MLVWRLVTRRVATLAEIEGSWSFLDLQKANAMLDYTDDIERQGMGDK